MFSGLLLVASAVGLRAAALATQGRFAAELYFDLAISLAAFGVAIVVARRRK